MSTWLLIYKNLYLICGTLIIAAVAWATGSMMGAGIGYLIGVWLTTRHDNVSYRQYIRQSRAMSYQSRELCRRHGKRIGSGV